MMTTPRWKDAGDRSDGRGRDGSVAPSRTHWSVARAASPRQLDEIKRRLRGGVYDTPQTLDALARRLIDSGEL